MLDSDKYIALFDVLGFKFIVENNLLAKVIEEFNGAIETIEDVRGAPNPYVLPSNINKLNQREIISYKMFSDTILIYTPNDSIESLYYLIMFCRSILRLTFPQGLLLRGAITKGQVYIKDDIFIGKPIVRAYLMEQQQDWVGCWIENECAEIAQSFNKGVFPLAFYPIPLKSGVVEKRWALNWVLHCVIVACLHDLDNSLYRIFTRLSNPNALTWEVQRKLKNTQLFIEYITDHYR